PRAGPGDDSGMEQGPRPGSPPLGCGPRSLLTALQPGRVPEHDVHLPPRLRNRLRHRCRAYFLRAETRPPRCAREDPSAIEDVLPQEGLKELATRLEAKE